jgi:cyanophycin synthetase
MNPTPKIAITGTKGKTTTTYVVATVLQALGYNVLRVDTNGHYVNGEQRSTLSDSKQTWGLVPTVCPGRYLWEMRADPVFATKPVAVLEAALGSSGSAGLGYRAHDVGVFLNVFEDHLGSSERLQSKQDIAYAKQFVFAQLQRDGWAVFNADDPLVVDRLSVIPREFNANLLPCGLEFNQFDLANHLEAGGHALTAKDGKIVLLSRNGEEVLFDLASIPWTFSGQYQPSVWNLLMAAATVYAWFKGEWQPAFGKAFEAVRLERYGGRLTVLQAASGTKIIADYAHEKVSLVELAKLGRQMAGSDGKVMAIVRLANDRTDELITETGRAIGEAYDELVVFDKIDGHWRQPKPTRSIRFKQVVGYTSDVLTKGIQQTNPHVTRILREDEAIERMAALAGPHDVVIDIVNDDIKRSVEWLRQYFQADFA